MHTTTVDPATIVLALALGATAQGQPNCPPPIQDAYRALKASLADAYPAVHCAWLENNPNRQSVRSVVAEDIEETQAHQDETILLHTSTVLFAVHHHAPQQATACGVSIRNTNTDGSLIVKDINSSGDGVIIHMVKTQGNIEISGVNAGETLESAAVSRSASVSGTSVGNNLDITSGSKTHIEQQINVNINITYQFKDDPNPDRERPELQTIDQQNRAATGKALIELKSLLDFESFDKEKLAALIEFIAQKLDLDEDPTPRGTRMGSTLITIELPDDRLQDLANLIYSGELAQFGITDIRRVYNLAGADLIRANLFHANLSGGNLSEADLNRANLFLSNLSGAKLNGTNLSGANLSGAKLNGANLSGANLNWTKFRAANLSGAKLNGANLSGANLSGANLSSANLSSANLSRAKFHLARYDGATRWPEDFGYRHSGAIGPQADLSGTDLSGTDLSGTDLSGTDLSEAKLNGANLSGTDLSEAKLNGANLSGANLSDANLSGANLRLARYDESTIWPEDFNYRLSGAIGPYANLSGEDLSGTDLSGANLTRANLIQTNLANASLVGANLSYANLIRADVSGADLSRADLSHSELTFITYDEHTIWPADFDRIGITNPVRTW